MQASQLSVLSSAVLEWSAAEQSPFDDDHAPSKHTKGYLSTVEVYERLTALVDCGDCEYEFDEGFTQADVSAALHALYDQKMVDLRKDDLFGDHVEQWALPFARANHIFGVSVHFRLRRLIVIDSCGGSQTEPTDVRRAAQLLVHEIHRLAGKGSFDWTGWKVVSLERLSPQQGRDVVNCGVYTLACFWALACGVSLKSIRKEDLSRWRQRFLVWLLDGGASLRRRGT